MTRRIAFTAGELVELRRALQLISEEDRDCRVNMDEQSMRDKASALAKITRVIGRSAAERMLDGAKAVNVMDIYNKKEET